MLVVADDDEALCWAKGSVLQTTNGARRDAAWAHRGFGGAA